MLVQDALGHFYQVELESLSGRQLPEDEGKVLLAAERGQSREKIMEFVFGLAPREKEMLRTVLSRDSPSVGIASSAADCEPGDCSGADCDPPDCSGADCEPGDCSGADCESGDCSGADCDSGA